MNLPFSQASRKSFSSRVVSSFTSLTSFNARYLSGEDESVPWYRAAIITEREYGKALMCIPPSRALHLYTHETTQIKIRALVNLDVNDVTRSDEAHTEYERLIPVRALYITSASRLMCMVRYIKKSTSMYKDHLKVFITKSSPNDSKHKKRLEHRDVMLRWCWWCCKCACALSHCIWSINSYIRDECLQEPFDTAKATLGYL